MAGLMSNMEDAEFLYNQSLQMSIKSLGANNVQTGHLQMDIGHFYLNYNCKNDALVHFEKAFLIYNRNFTDRLDQKNILKSADAALQIACILKEQKKQLNEAKKYI